MTTLAQLQREFQGFVLGERVGHAFDRTVIGSDRASSSERLDVYGNAYVARLVEILGNDYIGLRHLAGEETFDRLSRAYVGDTPSHHYNARWYGEGLPHFLRSNSPWSDDTSLHEMAELDWKIGLSFDSPDETFVSEADVAALSAEKWPELTLILSDSIELATFSWNVADIRRAMDAERNPEALLRHAKPQRWIISRQDFIVRYRRLDDDEAFALDAAREGKPFAELCDVLSEWHASGDVAMRAAILLKAWIINRWITGLKFA